MRILAIFALVFALYVFNTEGFGRAKEGKCPPLNADVNCLAKLRESIITSKPCTDQDVECPGDEKCCDDGCGGYECKPAIGLPSLPVIEPKCASPEIMQGECESANVTYCNANECNKCCIHDNVCHPGGDQLITKDECEKKLCKDVLCPGQGEICQLDKYHRAICECPTKCPAGSTAGGPVCGSDGVTYDNECQMNLSACVTGDSIRLVSQGVCLPPTQRNPLEICALPKEQGHGHTIELRYFFNMEKGICQGFIFYGRAGNENNFLRFKDCVDHCSEAVINVCSLPKITGPCRAAFPRWYFNSRTQSCEKFTYGGCSGNGNNFMTKQECNNQCICSLPKAEGNCLAYFPSWWYNSKTGKCEEFVYGGCRGNMNRFYNKEICQKTCGSREVDPFGPILQLRPRCLSKNKFNCRSIKKCLPVSLKCNGRDNCGDNSDEEGCDPCANKKCDFYSKCVVTNHDGAICNCPKICTADWNPVCASNNETYPNLCTMKVQSCEKQQMITKVRDGECNKRAKSKCEKEKAATDDRLILGAFIPQCNEDGSYKQVQCHGSTGYCWCVDSDGNKLEETSIRFKKPNCTEDLPPIERKSKCEQERDSANSQGLIGSFTPQCNKDGSYKDVQCYGSTGYCWCVDVEGNKLEETEVRFKRPNCSQELPIDICETTLCEFGTCVIVDGNAKCQCQKHCSRIFQPQCGSDGKIYPNLCVLKTRACERKQRIDVMPLENCKNNKPPTTPSIEERNATVNICDITLCDFGRCVLVDGNATCLCPKACPLIYNPVCASDGKTEKTYPNNCVMEGESCERRVRLKVLYPGKCKPKDPCLNVTCPFHANCVSLDGGTTKCDCPQICTREFNPVCGSDGVTYSNPCLMRVTSCEQQIEITKEYDGKCVAVKRISGTSEVHDVCKDVKCNFYAECVALKNSTKCDCPKFCTKEFDPVCGSDNETYSNPCLMRVSSCEKQTMITKAYSGDCASKVTTQLIKVLSKCHEEQRAAEVLAGDYIPQCNEDGSYKEVQCHGSTGLCWCVDKNGKTREGTEVFFQQPNCSQEPPTELPIDPCEISLCNFGTCVVVNGTATCECNKTCPNIQQSICASDNKTYSSICVMEAEACKREEYLTVKHSGPCGKKSKCQEELEAANANPRPGQMIPSCEADGSYSPKQCHSSTGYCWCVTRQGKKVPGSQIRFVEPDCSAVVQPDPCADVKCNFYAQCVVTNSGEHLCECPLFCTDEYAPVCASDGITYSNDCNMKVEACQSQTLLTVDYPGECVQPHSTSAPSDPCDTFRCDFGSCVVVNDTASCKCNNACPFIEAPVCGSDNQTYANLCVMYAEACESKQVITVQYDGPCVVPQAGVKDPCAETICGFHSHCKVVEGVAKCVCPMGCTKELDLKCGSDGVTYGNPCELRLASCEQMKNISIVSDGSCVPATTDAPTTQSIPKCSNCPSFGRENVADKFCSWYNKFAIIGEIMNFRPSEGGQEVTVKIGRRFKVEEAKNKLKRKSTVKIVVQKQPNCRCENLEFKKNEKYVLMGRRSKSKVFVVKWKTGFVEKVSTSLQDRLEKLKKINKSKVWGFCARKNKKIGKGRNGRK